MWCVLRSQISQAFCLYCIRHVCGILTSSVCDMFWLHSYRPVWHVLTGRKRNMFWLSKKWLVLVGKVCDDIMRSDCIVIALYAICAACLAKYMYMTCSWWPNTWCVLATLLSPSMLGPLGGEERDVLTALSSSSKWRVLTHWALLTGMWMKVQKRHTVVTINQIKYWRHRIPINNSVLIFYSLKYHKNYYLYCLV